MYHTGWPICSVAIQKTSYCVMAVTEHIGHPVNGYFSIYGILSVQVSTDDPVVCDLSDGSDIFADTLVRQMVMDQSFAIKNVSRIWHVFQDFFEYKLW